MTLLKVFRSSRLFHCRTSPCRARFCSLSRSRSGSHIRDLIIINYDQPKFCRYCSESVSQIHESQLENRNVEEKRLSRDLAKYVKPGLSPDFVKTLSTVTSIEVCLDSVYFASMTKDLCMTDWDHIDLLGSNHSKQSPSEILEQAFHIVEHLPESSIYLFEHRISRKLSLNHVPLLKFIARLQMSLHTLLDKEQKISGHHKVCHINDSFVTKAFDLGVGGERVSGQHILKAIEEEQYPDSVRVAPELWRRYDRVQSGVFKERYSNCFLMSLAFCQHILNEVNK